MSRLGIKQINNSGSTPDSYIAFNGISNVWRKIHHTETFGLSNLDEDGVLTVFHELGRKFVNASIFDEDDRQVIPDFIQVIDETTLVVGLQSFVIDMSEWTITVS